MLGTPAPEHPLPIYTYKCELNGHEFELRQPFSASPQQACPTCGSPARREIHAPSVHYKGSGFYTTDYARKGAGSSGTKAAASTSSDGSSKSASNGDAPSGKAKKGESSSSSGESSSSSSPTGSTSSTDT